MTKITRFHEPVSVKSGILAGKGTSEIRPTVSASTKPIGPEGLKSSSPTVEDIEAELGGPR